MSARQSTLEGAQMQEINIMETEIQQLRYQLEEYKLAEMKTIKQKLRERVVIQDLKKELLEKIDVSATGPDRLFPFEADDLRPPPSGEIALSNE